MSTTGVIDACILNNGAPSYPERRSARDRSSMAGRHGKAPYAVQHRRLAGHMEPRVFWFTISGEITSLVGPRFLRALFAWEFR